MKKTAVLISLILTFAMLCSFAAGAEEGGYTVISPYEDVVWEGENAWGAYKGNLHTHSNASDADTDYRDMILEYYRQGFDFLAMTDHSVNGKTWNQRPTEVPLYLYKRITGKIPHPLTDEEWLGVTSGSYPAEGTARGCGMVCVTGGVELNTLTIAKNHVNGLFLPANVEDGHFGIENDYENAVRLVDEAGGLSFINHPGDWLGAEETDSNPEKTAYFSDILLRYDSCLGIEVFNGTNKSTPRDRYLWDRLLMACLPYGKQVMGYANSDTHTTNHVDTSFMTFMMPENNMEEIRKTMQSGAFFAHARRIPADEVLGPAENLNASNSDLPYPTFRKITVDGHRITVEFSNANNLQWVGNGEVIVSCDFTEDAGISAYTLDLDTVESAEELLYVRCQLIGSGGITATQAFGIKKGDNMEYQRDHSLSALAKRIGQTFSTLHLVSIARLIKSHL